MKSSDSRKLRVYLLLRLTVLIKVKVGWCGTENENEREFAIHSIRPRSKAVQAFETLNETRPLWTEWNYSKYSMEMLEKLVRRYHDLTSTNDPLNENFYLMSRLSDQAWFNIERVAPFTMFMDWATATSRITDRLNSTTNAQLIQQYIQAPNSQPCAAETAFEIDLDDVLLSDDAGERAKTLNPLLESWFAKNEKTPPEKMCNRFRGLSCNPSTKNCECEDENSMHYVRHFRQESDTPGAYRDGCYVKAWNSCGHLHLDPLLSAEYRSFHSHTDNMKQFLLRLATPTPRLPRCEKGTYCVDMVLNMRRPICWCSSRMNNRDCYNETGVPLLQQFLQIRRQFHELLIPERDHSTPCRPDQDTDRILEEMQLLLEDIPGNFRSIYRLMKAVISKGWAGRFCDFRKGMACDPYRKVCILKTGCGFGRVLELGSKKCRVNNGYPCAIFELFCVNGAECKDFGMGRHCHCRKGQFGDLCRFSSPSFFAQLLQSRISGYIGFQFSYMQELVNHVLAPLERLMTKGHGVTCDRSLNNFGVNLVRYFGNVRAVVREDFERALGQIQFLVGRDESICDYRKFLGCSQKNQCEPMLPGVVTYVTKKDRIYLGLAHKARCTGPGNFSNVPQIFQDIVHIHCLPQHVCRRVDPRDNPWEKFCLCPEGRRGQNCEQSANSKQRENVLVYEIGPAVGQQPEPELSRGRARTWPIQTEIVHYHR